MNGAASFFDIHFLAAGWWAFWEKPLQGIVQWGGILLLGYVGLQLKPQILKTYAQHKAAIRRGAWITLLVLYDVFVAVNIISAGVYIGRTDAKTIPFTKGYWWGMLAAISSMRMWNALNRIYYERIQRYNHISALANPRLEAEKTLIAKLADLEGKPVSAEQLTGCVRLALMDSEFIWQTLGKFAAPQRHWRASYEVLSTVCFLWIAFYFIHRVGH